MFKSMRFLYIFLCTFIVLFVLRNTLFFTKNNISSVKIPRIVPSKQLTLTSNSLPKTFLKLNFSNFPESTLHSNPLIWASNKAKTKTEVYWGKIFENCEQVIIKLSNGAQILKLACGEPTGKFAVIGNGLNTSVLVQAWPLIERLIKKDPNLTIYLTELYGQGLTHLKLQNNQITGPDLRHITNPFDHYEQDMKETFKYLQKTHSQNQGIGIFFSSSVMSGLEAMQEYPEVLKKVVLVGPYLGLSSSEKVLQWIGHRLSFLITRRLALTPFADPLKTSWGLCSELLDERLKTLEEAQSQDGIPALHLLNLSKVCEIGSQILNPPIEWTNSANKHWNNLEKIKPKPQFPQTIIMRGELDSVSNLTKVKKLQKMFGAELNTLEGQYHNILINDPAKIAEKLIN